MYNIALLLLVLPPITLALPSMAPGVASEKQQRIVHHSPADLPLPCDYFIDYGIDLTTIPPCDCTMDRYYVSERVSFFLTVECSGVNVTTADLRESLADLQNRTRLTSAFRRRYNVGYMRVLVKLTLDTIERVDSTSWNDIFFRLNGTRMPDAHLMFVELTTSKCHLDFPIHFGPGFNEILAYLRIQNDPLLTSLPPRAIVFGRRQQQQRFHVFAINNTGLADIDEEAFAAFHNDGWTVTFGVVDFSHNRLTEVPLLATRYLPEIKTFILSHNRIANIRAPPLQIRTACDSLIDLSYNLITSVPNPAVWTSLTHTDIGPVQIFLDHNEIRQVAVDAFDSVQVMLRKLRMNHNWLYTMPMCFSPDRNVYNDRRIKFDVSLNQLQTIPNSSFSPVGWAANDELNFAYNPYVCSLDLGWLACWAQNRLGSMTVNSRLTCMSRAHGVISTTEYVRETLLPDGVCHRLFPHSNVFTTTTPQPTTHASSTASRADDAPPRAIIGLAEVKPRAYVNKVACRFGLPVVFCRVAFLIRSLFS